MNSGDRFGPFLIERMLGRGGMGEVYLAEHLRLGRKVAIKVLSPTLADDEGFRERFLRESKHAAALEHPNIVTVYDAADESGQAYIAMRFVDGEDLSKYVRSRGPLPPDVAVGILAQVAAALDAAHADGLVHRDVKPANILLEGPLEDGHVPRAMLSDFGITKRVGAAGSTTGQFVGTIDYMAPEQITGRPTDGRTDQYSLACVLFQCLTGRVPFPRDDQVGVMYAHIQAQPPVVAELRPELPPAIQDVIRRGMAKSARQRYDSCAEFVTAAAEALGVEAPTQVSWPPRDGTLVRRRGGVLAFRPHSARTRRRVSIAVGGVALFVAAAVWAGVLWWPSGSAPAATGTVTPSAGSSVQESQPPPTTPTTPPPSTPATTGPAAFPQSIDWRRVHDRELGGPFDQTMNRVTAGRSRFVAVGWDASLGENDAAVWSSRNGGKWHRYILGAGGGLGDEGMAAVSVLNNRFIAVGTVAGPDGSKDAAVWRSNNAQNWELDQQAAKDLQALGDQQIRRLIPVGSGLVAVGIDTFYETDGEATDAAVWRYDGSTWSHQTFPRPGSQELWSVAEMDRDLYAVGSDDRAGDLDAAVWRFQHGEWSPVKADGNFFGGPGDQVMKAIARSGSRLVAVGYEDGGDGLSAVAWTSTDGTHWQRSEIETSAACETCEVFGVAPYRGGFVAVGYVGTKSGGRDAAVWTSQDGVTWEPSEDPDLEGAGSQHIKGIAIDDDRLVAVGRDTGGEDADSAVWIGTPSD